MDNDAPGKRIFNELKRNLYKDNDEIARKYIVMVPNCEGIEDVFSKSDFKKYILNDENNTYTENNSLFMKNSKKSKPVHALNFMHAVDNNMLSRDDLDEDTINGIGNLIESIERLEIYDG